MHTFVSVNNRSRLFKAIDLLYKVNLVWISYLVFMLLFIAIPHDIEQSGVSATLANPENLLNLFLLFWFFRYWFRLRGTLFDLLLALLPIQLLLFTLHTTSDSSSTHYLTHALALSAILLLLFWLRQAGWLHRAKTRPLNPVNLFSWLLNPFILLGIPFYILSAILAMGIIYAAVSNQYYGGLFFLAFIPYLLRFSRRLTTQSAKLLTKIDKRPSILYLRSFILDNTTITHKEKTTLLPKTTIEETLASITARMGPFVAIADPNSTLQSLGAAKSRYGDHEWQAAVHDYTIKSRFIIMLAGKTTAIDWEVSKIKAVEKEMDLLVLFGEPVVNKLTAILEDSVVDATAIEEEIRRNYPMQSVVGAFKNDAQSLTFILGTPHDRYSYQSALHYFLAARHY